MLIMLELDGQYRTEGNEPHDMRAFQHGRTNGWCICHVGLGGVMVKLHFGFVLVPYMLKRCMFRAMLPEAKLPN